MTHRSISVLNATAKEYTLTTSACVYQDSVDLFAIIRVLKTILDMIVNSIALISIVSDGLFALAILWVVRVPVAIEDLIVLNHAIIWLGVRIVFSDVITNVQRAYAIVSMVIVCVTRSQLVNCVTVVLRVTLETNAQWCVHWKIAKYVKEKLEIVLNVKTVLRVRIALNHQLVNAIP